jgi:hypothetical protein
MPDWPRFDLRVSDVFVGLLALLLARVFGA